MWTLVDLVDPPILVYKHWLHLYKYRNPRMELEIELEIEKGKGKEISGKREKSKAT